MADRLADVLAQVGANVRRAREKRDWTQSDLGEAADLGWHTVQNIERGVRGSLASIVAIADALEVPVGSLFKSTSVKTRGPGRPKRTR